MVLRMLRVLCAGFVALLVAGQAVSVVDFRRAQRWGLQEKDANSEPLVRGVERASARWDLLSLPLLPLGLMLHGRGHQAGPLLTLFGAGVCFDAGGRELAKHSALAASGCALGSEAERRLYRRTMALLSAVGVLLVIAGGPRTGPSRGCEPRECD